MTVLRYRDAVRSITLETDLDPMTVVDKVRERFHPGVALEPDERFKRAMALQRASKRPAGGYD